jgi:methionyl-tRNA synthetase
MAVWEFISLANKYIVEQEPWLLAKDPARRNHLEIVLYNLLEALRFISVLILPFMPGTAEKIMRQIGLNDISSQNLDSIKKWGGLKPGSYLRRSEALFPRVTYEMEPARVAAKIEAIPLKPEITYEEFEKADVRAARVIAAEPVPKSDKLMKLTIDIGEERTIVAGIAKNYRPEELIGKYIAVVVNLKPTKLMGIVSRGMLLAADSVEGHALLTFDREPKTGAKIR